MPVEQEEHQCREQPEGRGQDRNRPLRGRIEDLGDAEAQLHVKDLSRDGKGAERHQYAQAQRRAQRQFGERGRQ
ncbi:hypothetical protein D3C84_1202540 [compost metagenome]